MGLRDFSAKASKWQGRWPLIKELRELSVTVLSNRGEARRQKFLEVAEQMFLKNGYAGTSVNEVVKEAGGSLKTLYRYFGNKLGLFEAVFVAKTDELFEPFLNCDYWQGDFETNLMNFGAAVQKIVLSPEGAAMSRLVVGENNQEQSQIRKIFYEKGPQRVTKILAKYFEYERQAGTFHLENTELAAAQFIEMVKGPFYYRSLFGEKILENEMQTALKQAVYLFR